MERTYICIDLKSYYASVECVHRGLDPLKANLLVADESRSDQTICLAVSPSLKAKGVPGRPRLFEAKQKIREYEIRCHTKVDYIIAVPRMAEYERISAQIYSIYLRYVAPEDIHVYSIDECFIDCTCYLHAYRKEAEKLNTNAAHIMAMTMIRDVLKTTGITATVGIGTNLYLAKVAMDIVAKKQPADKDGVRIAELNEDSYKFLLWDHKPLTDFWQIGHGKARRLEKAYMFTMGDIAARTQWDEEFFYKTFGIDGEILVDHAWGIEPVTMADIKSYKSDGHGLSNGQVLPRPYKYQEARLVFREMIEVLCTDKFNDEDTSTYLTLMKATIGEAIGANGGSDEIDLLERRIDALNSRMLKMVSDSVERGADMEENEDEFKTISEQIEQLNRRIEAIRKSEGSDEDRQERLSLIQATIDQREANRDTYDDAIVRQMIECVKVHEGGKLTIIFGGGYEIEEQI